MSKHPIEALKALVLQGIALSEAARQLGIPYQTAYWNAKQQGFLRRERPSYSHLYPEWRTAYENGMSIREIAAKWSVSTMPVRIAVRGMARSFTRHLGRPDYFSAIDTPEKAYWLGLLWADGSINDARSGQRVLQLGLTQHDTTDPKENEVGLMEAFRQALDTNYNIGSARSRKNTGDVLHLAIVSDQLTGDLMKHNLFPRKSESKLGEEPKDVPLELVAAFAKGLMDGDGTMYLSTRQNEKTGHISWVIQPRWTGGYNVLDWLCRQFLALGLVEKRITPKYGSSTCYFWLAPEDARRVIKAMYDTPGPSLRRKREKALSMITDLHPTDWKDYEGDQGKLPPKVQTPMTASEAARLGAQARWQSEDRLKVIHGDSFKLLPEMEPKSVELVLTDFPYGEASRQRGRRKWLFEPFTYEQTKRALELCGQVSSGWVIVATMDIGVAGKLRDDCPDPLRFVRVSTWEKENYFRTPGDAEYIVFFHRKGVSSKWYPPGVFKFKSNGHSGHPTSKPVALYAELIRQTTHEGAVVLDPFCGSGTTGRAAIMTGRQAILIDREEQYVKMARR